MKVSTILLLILTSQLTFAQNGKVKLFEFRSSTCNQEEDPSRLRIRIIKKELQGNILTVEIASTATCCVDFIPKAELKNGLLELDFEETGNACECFCCYEFIYRIQGVADDNVKIKFRNKDIEASPEKYLTYPIEFKIVNSDTVNFRDRYGLRQGKWLNPKDSLMYFIYSDDNNARRVILYNNKDIKSELISEKIQFQSNDTNYFMHIDFNRFVEYYASGQIKKECYNQHKGFGNYYQNGDCKEWNEKGELIYEGVYKK